MAEFRETLISRGIQRDHAAKLVSRSDYAKFAEGVSDRPSDAADRMLRESDQICASFTRYVGKGSEDWLKMKPVAYHNGWERTRG